MRITESRLRRVIRQVIRESMSMDSGLKSRIMLLAQGYTPFSPDHQIEFEDAISSLEKDMLGSLYIAIADACESASPGSKDADGGVIACLQSDQAGMILDQAMRSLGLH
tara:strand:- start:140 stop:466 length:327 start_codon:yes stop_codon:yes gene_type:complete